MSGSRNRSGKAVAANTESTNTDTTQENTTKVETTQTNEGTNSPEGVGVKTTDTGAKNPDVSIADDQREADYQKRLADLEAREQALKANSSEKGTQETPKQEEPVVTRAEGKTVTVTAIVDHSTNIGGVVYDLKKGVTYTVPEDVAAILSNAFIAVKK